MLGKAFFCGITALSKRSFRHVEAAFPMTECTQEVFSIAGHFSRRTDSDLGGFYQVESAPDPALFSSMTCFTHSLWRRFTLPRELALSSDARRPQSQRSFPDSREGE